MGKKLKDYLSNERFKGIVFADRRNSLRPYTVKNISYREDRMIITREDESIDVVVAITDHLFDPEYY